MGDRDRYIHLKEVSVDFIKRRPTSVLELVFKDDAGIKHKSSKFKGDDLVRWNFDTYVRAHTCATLTIQRAMFKISVAQIKFEFDTNKFGDYSTVKLEDSNHRVIVSLVCERSLADVTRVQVLSPRAPTNPPPRVLMEHPQLAVLPPLIPELGYNVPYPATSIHWLNDDILLDIFNCYRLDEGNGWNDRLGWCKLSHICQRWRRLIHECAFHLGLRIECTNGSPIMDTLDHLPPLPLFVRYRRTILKPDELGIYHALRLHDRIRQIDLIIPPFILREVIVLMDEHFPILEHLSLSSTAEKSITLTFPKAFLAPNLRYLALPSISPPNRLRLLTSTVSLVTLELRNIQTSSYFRPRLLAARLRSLPQLEVLSIEFSIPIPRPSTERELFGEQRAPVTLPRLKKLRFKGVGAYLESLVAQIRAPLLVQLDITLFNQIAFVLPHLYHLINTTEAFKHPRADVYFYDDEVYLFMTYHHHPLSVDKPFHMRMMCKHFDWQIDWVSQTCHALIPALSGVEKFLLHSGCDFQIPAELQDNGIDSTTWHDLLRPLIGVKELCIDRELLEELSRALQMDEVGTDPGFLPNLRRGSPCPGCEVGVVAATCRSTVFDQSPLLPVLEQQPTGKVFHVFGRK